VIELRSERKYAESPTRLQFRIRAYNED